MRSSSSSVVHHNKCKSPMITTYKLASMIIVYTIINNANITIQVQFIKNNCITTVRSAWDGPIGCSCPLASLSKVQHLDVTTPRCMRPADCMHVCINSGNTVKRKSVTVAKKQLKLTLPYGTAAGTVGDLRHPRGALQYNQVQQDIALRGMSYTTLLHQKSGQNTKHVHICSHSKSQIYCRSHRSHMNLNNIPSTPHFTPLQVLEVTGDFCSIFSGPNAGSFLTTCAHQTTTPYPLFIRT